MEQENILDSIICKEQNEIIKINERTNEMKKKIMELKEELEIVTGRVVKFKRNGKIDMRSIKLNTEQQKAFNIIQKRKCEERKLKRANEFHEMIKNCLTQIANERNLKATHVIETPKIPLERKRW
jgi:predicted RNA-binding protein with RPS1 domain